ARGLWSGAGLCFPAFQSSVVAIYPRLGAGERVVGSLAGRVCADLIWLGLVAARTERGYGGLFARCSESGSGDWPGDLRDSCPAASQPGLLPQRAGGTRAAGV